jgi:hypothetical protein
LLSSHEQLDADAAITRYAGHVWLPWLVDANADAVTKWSCRCKQLGSSLIPERNWGKSESNADVK